MNPGKDSILTIHSRSDKIKNNGEISLINVDNKKIDLDYNPHNQSPGKFSVFTITKPGGGVIKNGDQINLICTENGEVIYGKGLGNYQYRKSVPIIRITRN